MKLIFSEIAFKQLSKLAPDIQNRINGKLDFYLAQKDPLYFAEKLNDYEFGEWRFRIGDYRAILLFSKSVIEKIFINDLLDE